MSEIRGRKRAMAISAIAGGLTAFLIGLIAGCIVSLVKNILPLGSQSDNMLLSVIRYSIPATVIGSALGSGIGMIVESFRNEAHGAMIGGITGAAIWAFPGLVLGYSVEILTGSIVLVVLAVIGSIIGIMCGAVCESLIPRSVTASQHESPSILL